MKRVTPMTPRLLGGRVAAMIARTTYERLRDRPTSCKRLAQLMREDVRRTMETEDSLFSKPGPEDEAEYRIGLEEGIRAVLIHVAKCPAEVRESFRGLPRK